MTDFADDVERAEYVERVCGAWDFGIPPEPPTFALFSEWRNVFDEYPLIHLPGYHAFRTLYGWPAAPTKFSRDAVLAYELLDRAEGRGPDPFADLI
jgi:hypothetical protein